MATYGSFLYGSGILYGSSVLVGSVSPDRGPSTGGNSFILSGSGFALTSWDDDFTAGALDGALWNDISSGTGAITTGSSHLSLSTGATSSSVAGIESIPIVGNFQYEVSLTIPRITSYPASDVDFFTMSYYIDANNYAKMSVVVGSTSGDITLNCTTVLGGNVSGSYEIAWSTGIATFRMLRWMNKVYFIANGSVVYVSGGFNYADATYRIYATNNSASYDASGIIVNSFCSKPYVVFRDTPVFDTVVVSGSRVRGTVPPSIDDFGNEAGYAGDVTIYMVGITVGTLASAYEYYYEKSLVLVDNQQDGISLSIIDPIVRTPSDVRRGL